MDCTVMWPVRHDMTRDECRKSLRRLELDAYGNMVSVLRAQGPFTNEKQKLLQELAKVLHISNERHRAEVRRAVNDEKLAMIAEQLNGPNTGIDWTIEGRRTIPLLPRLKSRNAFTTLANSLSLATTIANIKKPMQEKIKDAKDAESTPDLYSKSEEKPHVDVGQLFIDTKLHANDRKKRPLQECVDEQIQEINSTKGIYDFNTDTVVSKDDTPSLPIPPPNKVLVVPSNTLESLNDGPVNTTLVETNTTLQTTKNPHENITIISLSANSVASSSTASSKVALAQKSIHNQISMQANKSVSATVPISVANGTKPKVKTIVQNIVSNSNTTPAVLLPSNISSTSGNDVQTDIQNAQAQDSKAIPLHSPVKSLKSENANSGACIKRVASVIHPSVKSGMATKSVVSNNIHRVMTVCPGTAVSSGPGPPYIKQTASTLACKKLPSGTLSHQPSAKMGVTLNSNKTVNITQHANTKLTTKTNVIVIQKGHTKGVTLSHAGKEVLGKVIMGGKNLRVANQQNSGSLNMLQQHVTVNNGEQVTTLPPTASLHAESVKGNVKDILEKSKVLSHLLKSSTIVTSDSKTVIKNTTGQLSKEESNSMLHSLDAQPSLNTDSVITPVAEEKQHRKSEDVCANVNSHLINSLDSPKLPENKDICINPSQLTSMQDDMINNIHIEDPLCNTELNVFDTALGSTDIEFENFQYLVEKSESHVLEEATSPILSVSQITDYNES